MSREAASRVARAATAPSDLAAVSLVANPAAANRVAAMARRGPAAANLVVSSRVENPVAVAVPAEPVPAKAQAPAPMTVQALALGPTTTASTEMLPATAISRCRATRKVISPQQQPAQQPVTQRAQPCPSH